MPKRKPPRGSDYLQFRPYRAFTGTPGKTEKNWHGLLLAILGIGILAVTFVILKFFTN